MKTSGEEQREAEALQVLGHTEAPAGVQWFILLSFAAVVLSVALLQPLVHAKPPLGAAASKSLEPATAAPQPARNRRGWRARLSPPETEVLRRYEKRLEERSAVGQWLRPAVAQVLVQDLHQSSGNVLLGSEDWLFYRKDVDHVLAGSFLDRDRLSARRRVPSDDGATQPDPTTAVVRFSQLLAARGIKLIALPVPGKPSIYPEFLSGQAHAPVDNAGHAELVARLRNAGVTVVDPLAALVAAKAHGELLYAKRDTHWNGYGIEVAANLVADQIQALAASFPQHRFSSHVERRLHAGDLDGLLKLEHASELVACFRVEAPDGQPFAPTRGAPIVLLGDSFSTACSENGARGGLAASIAAKIGTDVDLIASAGGGSRESRVAFEAQPERFANVKVVVWEFVARSLSFGNWR